MPTRTVFAYATSGSGNGARYSIAGDGYLAAAGIGGPVAELVAVKDYLNAGSAFRAEGNLARICRGCECRDCGRNEQQS